MKKSSWNQEKFIKLFKLDHSLIPPSYAVNLLSLMKVPVSSTTDTTSLNFHNIMTNFVVNLKTTNKQKEKEYGFWFFSRFRKIAKNDY